jgi:hypothetical protein
MSHLEILGEMPVTWQKGRPIRSSERNISTFRDWLTPCDTAYMTV